ncbi:MAG: CBS domain-containing protein [Hyphomicrobiaceae bacterium]
MKAHEVMTRGVVTVTPSTAVREVAALLAEKRISGIPVVADDGHVVGIISESDLLHRAEIGTEKPRKSWLRAFADPDRLAREFAKTHGMLVDDIMSRHIVSVAEDTELQDVVNLLEKHNLKRLPVIKEGRLVGLITRGDIVRALSKKAMERVPAAVTDSDLQAQILERMKKAKWLLDSYINLTVADGVVSMWGMAVSEDQRKALTVLINETPGVKQIDDRLRIGKRHMPTI